MTGMHVIASATFILAGYVAIVAILRTLIETKGWRE